MPRSRLVSFLFAIVVVLYLIQLAMIPRVTINWDEFQELATLFSKESGYPVQMLRKGLHYLIWPLKYLPLDEIDLVVAARYLAFLTVGTGTYLLIYAIGCRLHDRVFGMLAVFCALGFVSHYETVIQLRTDTYLTFCFTLSLYLLIRAPRGATPWLVPGLLMALAALISPKAIYHMATLGVCHGYLLLGAHRRSVLIRGLALATVALVGFLILTRLHMWFYGLDGARTGLELSDAAQTGFTARHGVAYKISFLRQVVVFALGPVVCLGFGLYVEGRNLGRWLRMGRSRALVWLSAVCLAGTVLLHQGTYKYYIITMLPPLALVAAVPIYRLWLRGRGSLWIGLFVASCLLVHLVRLPHNL